MHTILETIVDHHRARAAADDRDLDRLLAQAAACGPVRPFSAGISGSAMSVIAEIKRRSPSKGPLALDLVPAEVAIQYEAGGAAALSVLTDSHYFGGSPHDLTQARSACRLPVLRKDFTVDLRDLADARIMGADAVLLIVSALGQLELTRLVSVADQLGLTALTEVHDRDELTRAVDAGAKVIGVNQRDLRTFAVDRHRAEALAPDFPPGSIRVAESGIRGGEDLVALAEAGYHAVLVGEHLIMAANRARAVAALVQFNVHRAHVRPG
ncbi:MAG: indole-3-glycerol phosphate synthase TrpC [Acidimicrobiales bacterium]